MKNPRDVVIAPVISEKSYEQLEQNVYVFKVHTSASKPEIRRAVESIFDVAVTKVNTLNRKGKVRRSKLYYLRDRMGKARRLKELRTAKPKKKGETGVKR